MWFVTQAKQPGDHTLANRDRKRVPLAFGAPDQVDPVVHSYRLVLDGVRSPRASLSGLRGS
jgi:hypothetical protein